MNIYQAIQSEEKMAQLIVEKKKKKYDGTTMLQDISLYVGENEIVSLLGASGVGKTTLFHIIAGVEIPDMGNIYYDNEEITGETGKFSYMLQKDLLFPHKTILDNVALPFQLCGESKKQAREKAKPYFGEFGLDGTEDKYPYQLSGGMKQRAAFLRTFLYGTTKQTKGNLFLLDEPFSALDALTKKELQQWYRKQVEKYQISTLFITHDIDEAILLSDRIYILGGRPARICEEIVVERQNEGEENFELTEQFLNYKKKIMNWLTK